MTPPSHGLLRRAALVATSQGLSSASNAALLIVLAASPAVGRYASEAALLAVAYVVPLSIVRVTVYLDVLRRGSQREFPEVAAAFAMGLCWIPIGAGAAALLAVPVAEVVAVVPVVPFLLAQDVLRGIALVERRSGVLLLADLLWLVGFLVLALLAADHGSGGVFLACWSIGGCASGGLLARCFRTSISVRRGWLALRDGMSSNLRRAAESVVAEVALATAGVVLALRGFDRTAAHWKVLQSLFGPLQVLIVTYSTMSALASSRRNTSEVREISLLLGLGGIISFGLAFLLTNTKALPTIGLGPRFADIGSAAYWFAGFQLAGLFCQPWLLRLRVRGGHGLVVVRLGWLLCVVAGALVFGGSSSPFFAAIGVATAGAGVAWWFNSREI
jgi:hypothetical protein